MPEDVSQSSGEHLFQVAFRVSAGNDACVVKEPLGFVLDVWIMGALGSEAVVESVEHGDGAALSVFGPPPEPRTIRRTSLQRFV